MKGEKTGGRQKGTPNKVTAELKAAIMGAFNDVGGREYLVGVANANPQVFCTLLGKVLPSELTGEGGGPLTLTIVTGVPERNS